MNKFASNLARNNKAIKETRANRIASQAKMAQDALVMKLQKEKMELEAKLEDLEDLNPDTALSLNPIKGEFDADKWVNEIQDVKVALLNKKVEVTAAENTLKEYFTDEEK